MRQWLNIKISILILLAAVGSLFSCNKNNFLDKKPSSGLLIPTTLEDFQALLDNDDIMQETPVLGEVSADDYYLADASWRNVIDDVKEQNAYIWAPDIYAGHGKVEDWDLPYQQVFYANVVLEGLPGVAIDSSNAQEWRSLQGAAYFIRAYAFYNVAQVFAGVYNKTTAMNDLGVPIRLTSDVNAPSVRATMQNTYIQIFSDLQKARNLLPLLPSIAHLNRPSQAAVLAMMARVYLSMQDYTDAGFYADSCLKIDNTLIDYNTVDPNLFFPFQAANAETMYQSHLLTSSQFVGAGVYPSMADSNFYRSYAGNDLRKYILFNNADGIHSFFKPGYAHSVHPFSGLATDEIYLIRAECSARANHMDSALNDLNLLMKNRRVSGSFIAYTVVNTPSPLDTILTERRKELPFRGLRWTDLRRLNADERMITPTRLIAGEVYTLVPGSNSYIMPIPPDVPGLTQNPQR